MIRGFAPDLPRTTPGIMTDCENVLPSATGMEGAASPVDIGLDSLAAACVGARSLSKIDDTVRVFAGTATKLYELSGTSWTDRSAGGGTYTTTSDWQFAQFGDVSLAVSTAVTLQASSSGAFAAVSGAPKAKVLFTVVTSGGGFVVAANTDTSADQWACSGVNDHTAWTPSVATQSNSGRLLGNATGGILAGIELGDAALLFKRKTMFVGRYVGGAETFEFSEMPGGAGCVGPNALCTVGEVGVFFVGPDQFWLFDGSRPMPVGAREIRQWFVQTSSTTHRAKTRCVYEGLKNRVRIFYASKTSSGELDAQIVYHVDTQQWGRQNLTIEAAFSYVPAAITMDNVTGTMDDVPETMDSNYWKPSETFVAYFDSTHTLHTLTGATRESYFVTEDFGDETQESYLAEARVRFEQVPQGSQATPYALTESGATPVQGPLSTRNTLDGSTGKFDFHQCAKFHRIQFNFSGNWQLLEVKPTLRRAGAR